MLELEPTKKLIVYSGIETVAQIAKLVVMSVVAFKVSTLLGTLFVASYGLSYLFQYLVTREYNNMTQNAVTEAINHYVKEVGGGNA